MPKSGSTFLASIFGSLSGFRQVALLPDYGRREQEICVATLQGLVDEKVDFVAQQHIRCSKVTETYINHYNLKTIVLVRNIYDVIPSMVDHWFREDTVGSMCYVPEEYKSWDKDKAYEFITRMCIPWYFNFYVSWMSCTTTKFVFVTYEELANDPFMTVMQICELSNMDFSELEILNAIEKTKTMDTRKGHAIAGRGEQLSSNIKQEIMEMASFYKGFDFTHIGIE